MQWRQTFQTRSRKHKELFVNVFQFPNCPSLPAANVQMNAIRANRNTFGCKTLATIVYETHHGTHERWCSCCDNRFRAWESKTNFDMENDHLGSGDDSIRVRPSCVAIREDPTVPHKPSCRGKLFSVRQRIGDAIGDCQTKNDNAVPQNFGWDLLGVETSKSDVQLLSKASMNELWKSPNNLSKRCEHHGTYGSQKISGTNYSEGPSRHFNI